MPTTQEHENKQNWTQFTLVDLQHSQNSPQHADWIVTIAFYKALHAVDSYLAQKRIHPKGHTASQGRMGRNQYVKKYLRIIYPEYNALYRANRNRVFCRSEHPRKAGSEKLGFSSHLTLSFYVVPIKKAM